MSKVETQGKNYNCNDKTLNSLRTKYTAFQSHTKWTKISSLEIDIFCLKIMAKSGLELYFEIHRAPSELLLPSAKKSAH